MSQITLDPIVFAEFFEQYRFNTPNKRVELERMLRSAVDVEITDMIHADRADVLFDCDALIQQARQNVNQKAQSN